jgi:hypothetical protein
LIIRHHQYITTLNMGYAYMADCANGSLFAFRGKSLLAPMNQARAFLQGLKICTARDSLSLGKKSFAWRPRYAVGRFTKLGY